MCSQVSTRADALCLPHPRPHTHNQRLQVPEGKGENSFAFDGRWLDAATARAIVASTHAQWRGVVDARTGYCRVLTERLGVEINAVKVFEPTGADGSKGSSIDIKARPVTAEHAAKLVKHVLLKRRTAEHTTMA